MVPTSTEYELLLWRSMKSERAGDSEARRARRPARVWGNLVGGSVGGVCADDENGLVRLVKVRARANVNRDRMADFFSLSGVWEALEREN